MKKEPFYERFKRLVPPASYAQVEVATGLSRDKLRRLSSGGPATLEFEEGLALARYLKISPWDLAGQPLPLHAVPEQPDRAPEFELKFRGGALHLWAWLIPSGAPIPSERVNQLRSNIQVALSNAFRGTDIAVREIPVADAVMNEDASQPGPSSSVTYRLRSLEADAEDNLRAFQQVREHDAALHVLLDAEELPRSLRDRLQAALEPAQAGQS